MDSEFNPIDWSVLESLKLNPPPRYRPGDEAWIIQHKESQKVKVLAVSLKICDHHGSFVALVYGYDLGSYHQVGHRMSLHYYPYELYATKEAADAYVVWRPVTDISDDAWMKAIGDREDEDDTSIEECELARCCAEISEIRDMLINCKEELGMLERDRAKLEYRLTHGGCGHILLYPLSEKPNLERILTQLRITIPDPKTLEE